MWPGPGSKSRQPSSSSRPSPLLSSLGGLAFKLPAFPGSLTASVSDLPLSKTNRLLRVLTLISMSRCTANSLDTSVSLDEVARGLSILNVCPQFIETDFEGHRSQPKNRFSSPHGDE